MNVTLDRDKHEYTMTGADGVARKVVSVTQVLQRVGAYGPPARFWGEETRERGSMVHYLCAMWNRGEWHRANVLLSEPPFDRHPTLHGYLTGWAAFLDEYEIVPRPDGIEAIVGNELFSYAGQIDLVTARWRTGPVAGCQVRVGDIKAGQPHPAHMVQCAAYKEAWNSTRKIGSDDRARSCFCVYLAPDGSHQCVEPTLAQAMEAKNAWFAMVAYLNYMANHNLLERRSDED